MSGEETAARGRDLRSQYTRTFDEVLEAERALISTQRIRRGVDADAPVIGVALSGGGIRSSTFGLGVLEALDARGVFRSVDYLSTVSGGGYIGTALSWFVRQTEGRFPFTGPARGPGPDGRRVGDYLRLHANYLDHTTPGTENGGDSERKGAPVRDGFSLAGLFAVVGQQMLITMMVYGGLLVAGFFVLHSFDSLLRPLKAILALELNVPADVFWLAHTNFMMLVGLALLLIYVLLAPYFALRMYLASRLGKGRRDEEVGRLREYALRLHMERTVTAVIQAAVFSLLVGSVPLVAEWVASWIDTRWIRGSTYGLLATAGGLLGLFQNGRPRGGGGALTRILQSPMAIRVTALLTLYSLLLAAHSLAVLMLDGRTVWFFWVLVAVVLGLGIYTDVNTLGSHRMYRDRLMETFMPEGLAVESGNWQPAYRATAHLLEDAATETGPYHFYNAALTTLGSSDPKLHTRGADNFVLAPLFSGSTATGWRRTSSWPRRGLTVPTAMAVSAAAVNPGAGSAGRGATTGWGVATLLALLNLRLGYWVDNPDPDLQPRSRRVRPGLLLFGHFPLRLSRVFPWIRFRMPVLLSLLPHPFGPRQHERRPWLELDDGGAFEATGVYELVRRRADVIFVSDATGDERYTFECMGDVVGRVWNDFGVDIGFEDEERSLHALRPGSSDEPPGPDGPVLSARAHTVGRIRYPALGNEPAKTGVLVLIKAALIPGLPVDVLAYRAENPEFPNESTFNQFFSERQFEAYRRLGYYAGVQMLDDPWFREHVMDPPAVEVGA
jgi:hypothetical protein